MPPQEPRARRLRPVPRPSASGAASRGSVEEASEEFRFSISDPWSHQLFVALCRRYGLRPFRYSRMHRQSVVVQGPRSFVDGVLWPEFEELSVALTSHLGEITDRIIREEVHASIQDAEEVRETPLLR